MTQPHLENDFARMQKELNSMKSKMQKLHKGLGEAYVTTYAPVQTVIDILKKYGPWLESFERLYDPLEKVGGPPSSYIADMAYALRSGDIEKTIRDVYAIGVDLRTTPRDRAEQHRHGRAIRDLRGEMLPWMERMQKINTEINRTIQWLRGGNNE